MNANLRVKAGARVLDSYAPDWAFDVDIRTLNLNSTVKCILGQVFGHFDEGMELLLAAGPENHYRHISVSRRFGFCAGLGVTDATLEMLWMKEILERIIAAR